MKEGHLILNEGLMIMNEAHYVMGVLLLFEINYSYVL